LASAFNAQVFRHLPVGASGLSVGIEALAGVLQLGSDARNFGGFGLPLRLGLGRLRIGPLELLLELGPLLEAVGRVVDGLLKIAFCGHLLGQWGTKSLNGST
jgi:hypothetical protein